VIDINMGCPSKRVTNGYSGSALMRDLDNALTLIDAVVETASVPVTLKMRLGWDRTSINAPELAKRAEQAGVTMITVHGRTRDQFYKGEADWDAIRPTRDAIDVPLIANGDIICSESAKAALEQSGADGVMIGRGAMGQPWLLGEIAAYLSGETYVRPTLSEQCDSICEQVEDSAALYGAHMGLRTVRKHVAAHIDKVDLPLSVSERRALRSKLCQLDEIGDVLSGLQSLYAQNCVEVAA